MHLADADNLAQDQPTERGNQRRADVGRQKSQSGCRCQADAAVKCPGRAIDSQGERIDLRIAYKAETDFSLKVPTVCDGKQ